MKIGMMGFDFESPNKGCEALTYSFINMLLECYGNDLQIVNFSYGGFGIFPERYPEIDFLIRRPKIKNPIDWTFVEECWQQPYREFQYIAMDYLDKKKKELRPEDFPKLKELAQIYMGKCGTLQQIC